jgi:predicted nuclease of restriction endonuclease-like (RecB) superfamily
LARRRLPNEKILADYGQLLGVTGCRRMLDQAFNPATKPSRAASSAFRALSASPTTTVSNLPMSFSESGYFRSSNVDLYYKFYIYELGKQCLPNSGKEKQMSNEERLIIPMAVKEPDEIGFYKSIAEMIKQARHTLEKTVNTTMVVTYYEIGRRIVEKEQQGEKRAQYGKRILKELSEYLTSDLGKGYSVENLKLMRRFYTVYAEQSIGQTTFTQFSPNISWSHYIQLMRIKDLDERKFYEFEIADNGWSFKEFQRQYDSSLYERLALSRDKNKIRELAEKGQILETPQDLFKDPYVLEFTGLPEKADYTETELEQRLIDHLQKFLLELGKGFAFMKRQARFTFEEESFFVDLVFYNRLLRCFVLLDLKIGKLKHQDVGQMQTYVNYYDRKVKLPDENPTIGIVLCKDKKDALVEMMLPEENNRIFAGRYQTVLPSKEELRKALEIEDEQ